MSQYVFNSRLDFVFVVLQVLAHRGSHWTTLQHVCHTVWDHSCRIASLAQTAVHLEPDSPLTAERLHTTITQLLSLATDLIMDMLNSLGVCITFCYLYTHRATCLNT